MLRIIEGISHDSRSLQLKVPITTSHLCFIRPFVAQLVPRALVVTDGVRLAMKESGELVGKSVGPVIKRLRVRIPSGAVGEFSSPELTLCNNSNSVSVPSPCYRSGT